MQYLANMSLPVPVITIGHIAASMLFCYLYAVHFQSRSMPLKGSNADPDRQRLLCMSKKSVFAKDWWIAEEQLELEFRAVLSKVCKPSKMTLKQGYVADAIACYRNGCVQLTRPDSESLGIISL